LKFKDTNGQSTQIHYPSKNQLKFTNKITKTINIFTLSTPLSFTFCNRSCIIVCTHATFQLLTSSVTQSTLYYHKAINISSNYILSPLKIYIILSLFYFKNRTPNKDKIIAGAPQKPHNMSNKTQT
jgi:hypothetical protein